jgi:uncharacterized membrane protein
MDFLQGFIFTFGSGKLWYGIGLFFGAIAFLFSVLMTFAFILFIIYGVLEGGRMLFLHIKNKIERSKGKIKI